MVIAFRIGNAFRRNLPGALSREEILRTNQEIYTLEGTIYLGKRKSSLNIRGDMLVLSKGSVFLAKLDKMFLANKSADENIRVLSVEKNISCLF